MFGFGKLEAYGVILAIVALAAAAFGFYEHHQGYLAGKKETKAEWDAAILAQQEKEKKQSDAAATKLENGNAQAKVVYRTITQTVDKIVEKPVYRSACFDTDGLSVANQALAGSLAVRPAPNVPMPRPDAAPRRNGIVSAAQAGRNQ